MDLCLYGLNHGVSAEEVADAAHLTPEQVALTYRDIESKRKAARYLHAPPLLIEAVSRENEQ
jgi:NAD+ synthase